MENRNEVKITKHGVKRTKERVGLSKKIADKNAQKALDLGVKHSETKGSLKKFMDALYLKYKNSNNTRIYNRKVYLFHGRVLITIINLPNKFSAAADKIQKRKLEQLTKDQVEVKTP